MGERLKLNKLGKFFSLSQSNLKSNDDIKGVNSPVGSPKNEAKLSPVQSPLSSFGLGDANRARSGGNSAANSAVVTPAHSQPQSRSHSPSGRKHAKEAEAQAQAHLQAQAAAQVLQKLILTNHQIYQNQHLQEPLQQLSPSHPATSISPSAGSASQIASQLSSNNSSSIIRSSSVSKPQRSGQKSPSPAPSVSTAAQKPRFRMTENGLHEHNLRSARRQEKLSNMLKDLLGAKKLRDEAKSAVPNILESPNGLVVPEEQHSKHGKEQPPTLISGLVSQFKHYNQVQGNGDDSGGDPDCKSFVQKYGRCQEVIGKGSYGTVRISHKRLQEEDGPEILYAVKEFKKKPNELEKKFNRRLTSEFCISSSLKNINIIDTLDLLKDAKGDFCEVMEFCSGGDLYTLIIASGKLEYAEADCFFKQLIRGVNYMHDMGVAHRDLKPENLLLTQNGVIKITDFGNSECFKMAWEQDIQLSEGICGSSPYIAPEEFKSTQFDPRCVDIWSCGVIYMAMRTGRQLWSVADEEKDEFFKEYLVKRKNSSGYEPIESLKRARCRNVIYSILDPKLSRRITGKQILNSEWGREIKLCHAASGKLGQDVQ